MTVFVTDAKTSSPRRGGLRWARLYADTDRELSLMAAQLRIEPGMRFERTPTQNPYYVITPEQRAAALSGGAKAVCSMPAAATTTASEQLLLPDAKSEVSR